MTSVLLEFCRPDGKRLRNIDAGFEFMDSAEIPLNNAELPIRVETGDGLQFVTIPLPDGLATNLQIIGKNLYLPGNAHSLKVRVAIDGVVYELTVSVASQLSAVHTPDQRAYEDYRQSMQDIGMTPRSFVEWKQHRDSVQTK